MYSNVEESIALYERQMNESATTLAQTASSMPGCHQGSKISGPAMTRKVALPSILPGMRSMNPQDLAELPVLSTHDIETQQRSALEYQNVAYHEIMRNRFQAEQEIRDNVLKQGRIHSPLTQHECILLNQREQQRIAECVALQQLNAEQQTLHHLQQHYHSLAPTPLNRQDVSSNTRCCRTNDRDAPYSTSEPVHYSPFLKSTEESTSWITLPHGEQLPYHDADLDNFFKTQESMLRENEYLRHMPIDKQLYYMSTKTSGQPPAPTSSMCMNPSFPGENPRISTQLLSSSTIIGSTSITPPLCDSFSPEKNKTPKSFMTQFVDKLYPTHCGLELLRCIVPL